MRHARDPDLAGLGEATTLLGHTGETWQAIADGLTDDAVPTPAGGARWYPSMARSAALAYQRDAVALEGR